jgi:protocatechuate 3,4-dioxygenase beta subunit
MRNAIMILMVLSILTACTGTQTPFPSLTTGVPFTSTPEPITITPALTSSAGTPTALAASNDFFTRMNITLPAPTCDGLTQSQTEGPYYKSDTPARNSFLEEGLLGTRLVLVGYVLDENCQPLPDAWLDFWQADADGEYDNAGYRLRGHQFTDAQGRYYLDTILPGLYSSRPIEHIHVKVRPADGEELTTQLYFPEQPVDGLTVTLEEKEDYFLGYFNFVLQP